MQTSDTTTVSSTKKNVLGEPLQPCCFAPLTGYFRDGFCRTDNSDFGRHIICAEMTAEFLAHSKQVGNDLSTPRPEFDFPGLQPGDRWCLCALRWKAAWEQGLAPPVLIESCEESALKVVPLEVLKQYAKAALN